MSGDVMNCWPGSYCFPWWDNLAIGLGIGASCVLLVFLCGWLLTR